MILQTASSIVTYDNEHKFLGIPSLTLLCLGCERSTIRCHFPEWAFGITPNLLICALGISFLEKGPTSLLLPSSSAK